MQVSIQLVYIFFNMTAMSTYHDSHELVLCEMLLVLGSRAISGSDITAFHDADVWTEIVEHVLSALALDISPENKMS